MDQPWRILVSGTTGFIGSALLKALREDGHNVVRLLRSPLKDGEDAVLWDPRAETLESLHVEGFDAVVHLAAESIAAHRWTKREKQRIMDSRAHDTRLLCEKLAALARPPRVVVCASAMGFYGERGDDLLTEKEPPGKGFLCDVVRAWEEATHPASERGIRVVNLRLGIVLGANAGTLGELLPLFRIGLGGPLAGGRQFMSWITMQDVIAVIRHAVATETLNGPANAASPQPVRQREFAQTLGKVLKRPAWFDVPRWALRLRVGSEFADTILWSQRMVPEKLLASGYRFQYPDLEAGLRFELRMPLES